MSYRSNLPALRERLTRAVDGGLVAAATVVVNEVKRGLQGGYTSGDFTTGASLNAVTRTDPIDENGVRVIKVGTDLLYNLFWEVGHLSTWTRKFERKEVWMPALLSTADRQRAAFQRVFAAVFASGGPIGEAAD